MRQAAGVSMTSKPIRCWWQCWIMCVAGKHSLRPVPRRMSSGFILMNGSKSSAMRAAKEGTCHSPITAVGVSAKDWWWGEAFTEM